MNDILHRIHLGIMGTALCHATYGWFCITAPPFTKIMSYQVWIKTLLQRDLEL